MAFKVFSMKHPLHRRTLALYIMIPKSIRLKIHHKSSTPKAGLKVLINQLLVCRGNSRTCDNEQPLQHLEESVGQGKV